MTARSELHQHAVVFYGDDAELVQRVAGFVADGLPSGDGALVVGTDAHREGITGALQELGIDVAGLLASGQYVTLDAEQLLAEFMVGELPDWARFEAAVGGTLGRFRAPVRVFGEMVAVLWGAGNVLGADELEAHWNRLAETHRFDLLCGYPSWSLTEATLADVTRVCELHTAVSAAAPRADAADELVLPPNTASVPTARRFVTALLRSWEAAELVDDAALLVTELAANAVRHAASAFRVAVRRAGSVVRISVTDAAPDEPRPRSPGPAEPSGRGLAAVAAIATRWGWDVRPDGKEVWVELAG
jgi:anti-sigma regulatory factor (Ser/Thr protein kinase)